MADIYWEGNTKKFRYHDYEVTIDFEKHKKTTKWFCGVCKTYSAEKYNTYAICDYCAGKRK